MDPLPPLPEIIADELDLLASLVPLEGLRVVELGCGKAELARSLVSRFAGSRVAALEVDERQHAKNLAQPAPGIEFLRAGAQAIPFGEAAFDLALMLKSLHHVPLADMDGALAELRRVLRPGGHLYVSEPVFAGELNEVMRLFHDEQAVRAAAQRALDRALATPGWEAVREIDFQAPVEFADFADFERRNIDATFADHRLDAATLAAVRERFARHCDAGGARFVRPMRVRLLRRR